MIVNSKESNEENSSDFCLGFIQEFDLRINVLYTAALSCPPFTCTLQACMYRRPRKGLHCSHVQIMFKNHRALVL
jgi:hypothetical protein